MTPTATKRARYPAQTGLQRPHDRLPRRSSASERRAQGGAESERGAPAEVEGADSRQAGGRENERAYQEHGGDEEVRLHTIRSRAAPSRSARVVLVSSLRRLRRRRRLLLLLRRCRRRCLRCRRRRLCCFRLQNFEEAKRTAALACLGQGHVGRFFFVRLKRNKNFLFFLINDDNNNNNDNIEVDDGVEVGDD